MESWATKSVFYHIYPLGLCGAPAQNDFHMPPTPRLQNLHAWIEHSQHLGANAIYLGALFESSTHGYDTADYFQVDRRLGEEHALAALSADIHQRGMRLILDGVFNHVGRHFWAFRDVQQHGQASQYRDWFYGLDFNNRSPYGDAFSYHGWDGHYDLVKLNLSNAEVRQHLFQAVRSWVERFDVDGLRLDAADCLDLDFLEALAGFCRDLRPDFWLVGEVVHGDYRRWANPQGLNAVTNYECYKGLYSSHVDRNYYEIAYALNRQFGEGGLYRGLSLYNFADNHDVNRVASQLSNPAHLYPLYALLFSMPGVPSIYYGSEWGLKGVKANGNDAALRPALDLATIVQTAPQPDLADYIGRLAHIRCNSAALQCGDYRQVYVSHEQLGFTRQAGEERLVVLINAADEPAGFDFELPDASNCRLDDLLNEAQPYTVQGGKINIAHVPACGARILALAN